MVAMTATASKSMIAELRTSLGMNAQTIVVTRSPNRENIYLVKKTRGATNLGDKSYDDILGPIAYSLLNKKKSYPMTIVYLKLKYCAVAYKLFERILGAEQYVDGIEEPAQRLFAQYHSPQTERMKKDIMNEIMKAESNIRVVFATSALGMGVDVPYVEQIIHASPPDSLECYMQEVGRGARASTSAIAVLYYNSHDVSPNIKRPIHVKMQEYCSLEKPGEHSILQLCYIMDWCSFPSENGIVNCRVNAGFSSEKD